jgi:ATP-dependent protease ClpP protease subunit
LFIDEDIDLEDVGIATPIYSVNNHIFFYQEIDKNSAASLNRQLTEMYFSILHTMLNSGLVKPVIHLHLNSPGGEMFATFSILRTLESIKKGLEPLYIPCEVYTYIEGESSSGGSLISIAGTKRFINSCSSVLIHNAISGAEGKPSQFEDHIANTRMLVGKMKEVYIKYTKILPEQLDKMLEHDCYIDANECLEYGIVDHIE